MDKFSLYVKVNGDRPDFTIFAGYFFGDKNHNYDSDGNAYPFSSKKWTELYMRSREDSELYFDIFLKEENPLILEVSSEKKEYVYRVAYFLAKQTNGSVFDANNKIIQADEAIHLMGDFDLNKRLEIAKNSL